MRLTRLDGWKPLDLRGGTHGMGLEQPHQTMLDPAVDDDTVWTNGRSHAQATARVMRAHDHGAASTPVIGLSISLRLVLAKHHNQ